MSLIQIGPSNLLIESAVNPLCFEVPSLWSMMPLNFTVDNPSCEIWERIAYYTVCGESEEAFLGPPSEICSLALLSRAVYHQISFENNTHLYARIFRYKFDFLAPARRLSERWRTTKCLAFELIKRCQALKRIKATELNADDLWTAYLMHVFTDNIFIPMLIQILGCQRTTERIARSF